VLYIAALLEDARGDIDHINLYKFRKSPFIPTINYLVKICQPFFQTYQNKLPKMHLATTLSALFLSSVATAIPQTTRYYIKLLTVFDIDSSVSGPNSVDIPKYEYYGFQDAPDECVYYGYERFDYGHIEVGSGLSCNFYSQKGCSGSHFTVVGVQKTARGGSKEPVFLSFQCEYARDGGKGKGKGKGKGGKRKL
jgi:hypothetical protein